MQIHIFINFLRVCLKVQLSRTTFQKLTPKIAFLRPDSTKLTMCLMIFDDFRFMLPISGPRGVQNPQIPKTPKTPKIPKAVLGFWGI